jgi:hypothetical protein
MRQRRPLPSHNGQVRQHLVQRTEKGIKHSVSNNVANAKSKFALPDDGGAAEDWLRDRYNWLEGRINEGIWLHFKRTRAGEQLPDLRDCPEFFVDRVYLAMIKSVLSEIRLRKRRGEAPNGPQIERLITGAMREYSTASNTQLAAKIFDRHGYREEANELVARWCSSRIRVFPDLRRALEAEHKSTGNGEGKMDHVRFEVAVAQPTDLPFEELVQLPKQIGGNLDSMADGLNSFNDHEETYDPSFDDNLIRAGNTDPWPEVITKLEAMKDRPKVEAFLSKLPVVELTTLELKRQGLRNKDIAAREGVSEKAIEARVTSINKKLTAFQEKLEK